MSTANPLPQSDPSLASEQRAHEPSMEEILASIRRIIADDDALPLMRRPSLVAREPTAAPGWPEAERQSEPRHPPAPAAPVHLVAASENSAPGEIEDASGTDRPSAEHAYPPSLAALQKDSGAAAEDYVAQNRMPDDYELRGSANDKLSLREGHGGDAAMAAGAREAMEIPPAEHQEREERRLVSPATDASVASSFQSLAASMFLRDSDLIARTAREMLRPMLKQWLDDNLPVIVERLVRAEIERVARGGR